MRTIGIDLALTTAHKAVVADAQGTVLTPVLTVQTTPTDLERLLDRARQGAPDTPVQVVLEPTGMAWFPVAVFFARHNVPIFLVNSQEVADLRRYSQRHAKSDRIDARVLVRLPLVNPDKLHRLHLATAATLACQRACKQLDRLDEQIVALKNRIEALDRFAWPGLEHHISTPSFAPATRWFRRHWYDPRAVVRAGVDTIQRDWRASGVDPQNDGGWIGRLVEMAGAVLAVYGQDSLYLDFAELHAEVLRDQQLLEQLEHQHHQLRMEVVRPLYRQIHPSRALESLKGVGQDGAAVYASFIGAVERFASVRAIKLEWVSASECPKWWERSERAAYHAGWPRPRQEVCLSGRGECAAVGPADRCALLHADGGARKASQSGGLCLRDASVGSGIGSPAGRSTVRTARCGWHPGEWSSSTRDCAGAVSGAGRGAAPNNPAATARPAGPAGRTDI